MYEEIVKLTGRERGGTSIILTGVHGNESCGVEAIRTILPTLVIEKGVLLIAYGNPRAIEAGVRCTDSNLNRLFLHDEALSAYEKSSYEYGRAQCLKKYLNQSDALLDIHASTVPKSSRFVICEENAHAIVRYMPVDSVVSGFDTVEPGGTDYYMNRRGKVGICVECGDVQDTDSVATAEKSIFAFLKARGHLTNDLTPRPQSHIRMYKKYYANTRSFVLTKPFQNFEVVQAGQCIGIDGKEEIRAEKTR